MSLAPRIRVAAERIFRRKDADNGRPAGDVYKRQVGIRSLFGKNEYTPQCSIGVVSSGKQQELAKEFVKTLLSARVQDQNLGDGLPTVSYTHLP